MGSQLPGHAVHPVVREQGLAITHAGRAVRATVQAHSWPHDLLVTVRNLPSGYKAGCTGPWPYLMAMCVGVYASLHFPEKNPHPFLASKNSW